MARGKKPTRKTFPKKRKYSKRVLLVNKKAFSKSVLSVLHKQAETKEASTSLAITDFNGPVNNIADSCRLIPLVQQGTGNGARNGDTINAQRLRIMGHMIINAVPNTTGVNIPTAIPGNCRLMIRAFVCSVKKLSNHDDVSATNSWMTKFLKNGAVVQGLDGTVRSMYLPVNTDVITVHKEIRRYITVPAIYAQTSTAVGFSNTAVGFQNSTAFFKISLKCKKILKYDDTSFSPQNYAPVFVLSYCKLDDSTPDLITARVSCSYVSTLTYEDI